jgi:hypothetical protein
MIGGVNHVMSAPQPLPPKADILLQHNICRDGHKATFRAQ